MAKMWPKNCFFFSYFVSFFVYILLLSMSYTTRFCQMKYLIKICMCSMFHQYSIYLIVKLKIVKVSCTDSTSKKWPFLIQFGTQFNTGKPKILFKTKIFAKTLSLGISNKVSARSQKENHKN